MENINQILQKPMNKLSVEDQQTLVSAFVSQLRDEYACQDRGGLYGYVQRRMAFNSNRIEGSRLTEEETASLFETRELLSDGETVYRAKDIEEMSGHFLMFNEMLKHIGEPLSEDLIKGLHYQLTSGVFEFRANGYIPGEYKHRRNTVANIITSEPVNVSQDMKELLKWYHNQPITLQTLAQFHAKFETIHPFQDGNGRVGRILLFRECIEHGIIPFIIQDYNKAIYFKALKAYQTNDKDASELIAFFQSEQKEFCERMQYFMYDYSAEESVDRNYERE